MGYTPGPWKTVLPYYEAARKGGCLCVQIGKDDLYTTSEVKAADAHLISAAPDLLEVAEMLVSAIECKPEDITLDWIVSELQPVINRAKGEE